jgi:hypothetical protein
MQQKREGVGTGARENVAFWCLIGVKCMGWRGLAFYGVRDIVG